MTPMIREISVENRVEKLTEIYACFEAFAGEAKLAATTTSRLLLVVEELFTNLVRYGYEDGASELVTLRVALENDASVRLTIRDHAARFDVSQPPKEPAQDADLESISIGGLGLFLVHEFSRTLASWSEGSANITELVIATDP